MTKHHHELAERLRVALILSFISGFINAFTYITQGGRFAGIQTGNLISLSTHLALGHFSEALNFLLPILVFSLGQVFAYFARRWMMDKSLDWPFLSSLVMLVLITLTAMITPQTSQTFTIISLTFIASIQIDTFPKMHGVHYASVMMTGNLKHASFQLIKGLYEKNRKTQQIAIKLFLILLSFCIGVIVSTYLAQHLMEYSLFFTIFPFLCLTILLSSKKSKVF